jgi:hypothetical protein
MLLLRHACTLDSGPAYWLIACLPAHCLPTGLLLAYRLIAGIPAYCRRTGILPAYRHIAGVPAYCRHEQRIWYLVFTLYTISGGSGKARAAMKAFWKAGSVARWTTWVAALMAAMRFLPAVSSR